MVGSINYLHPQVHGSVSSTLYNYNSTYTRTYIFMFCNTYLVASIKLHNIEVQQTEQKLSHRITCMQLNCATLQFAILSLCFRIISALVSFSNRLHSLASSDKANEQNF